MQRIKIEFDPASEMGVQIQRCIRRPDPHNLGTIRRPGLPTGSIGAAGRAPGPVRSSAADDRLYAARANHRGLLDAIVEKMNQMSE